jgi:hypothetical protein
MGKHTARKWRDRSSNSLNIFPSGLENGLIAFPLHTRTRSFLRSQWNYSPRTPSYDVVPQTLPPSISLKFTFPVRSVTDSSSQPCTQNVDPNDSRNDIAFRTVSLSPYHLFQRFLRFQGIHNHPERRVQETCKKLIYE